MSIYQDSKGRWVADVYFASSGKRRKIIIPIGHNETEEKRNRFERELRAQGSALTEFSSVAYAYLEHLENLVSIGGMKIKTKQNAKHAIDALFIPFFGQLNVQEIHRAQVEVFKKKNQKDRRGRPKKISAQNQNLKTLKSIFRYALKNNLISKMPDIELVRSIKQPRAYKSLSKKELNVVFQQIPEETRYGLRLRDFCYFMLYSALRPRELLALKWTDVDEDAKFIAINRTATDIFKEGKRVYNTPKGGVGEVQLNKKLEEVLKRQPKRGEFIFCRTDGSEDNLSAVGKHLRMIQTSIGALTPKVFRHSFGRIAVETGIHIATIKKQMRHANITTTQIYLSTDRDLERTEADRMFEEG